VLGVVVLMAAVTYGPRLLPLVLLTRVGLPPGVRRWLEHVPAAILAAFLAQLLWPGRAGGSYRDLLAALPAVAVAARTRNLILTVLAGVATMYVLRLW
jgi:branched-subunit amino acid transport protein